MEADVKAIKWNGKNIGDIMNGVVFVAPRHGKKHLFRGGKGKTVVQAMKAKTAAWSFNVEILQYLKGLGVQVFVIEDRDAGKHYQGDKYYWRGVNYLEGLGYTNDYGEGLQRYIAVKDWRTAESLDGILVAVKTVFPGGK